VLARSGSDACGVSGRVGVYSVMSSLRASAEIEGRRGSVWDW
jgi:hypothetical protein